MHNRNFEARQLLFRALEPTVAGEKIPRRARRGGESDSELTGPGVAEGGEPDDGEETGDQEQPNAQGKAALAGCRTSVRSGNHCLVMYEINLHDIMQMYASAAIARSCTTWAIKIVPIIHHLLLLLA
jgi:hypothetical protein